MKIIKCKSKYSDGKISYTFYLNINLVTSVELSFYKNGQLFSEKTYVYGQTSGLYKDYMGSKRRYIESYSKELINGLQIKFLFKPKK